MYDAERGRETVVATDWTRSNAVVAFFHASTPEVCSVVTVYNGINVIYLSGDLIFVLVSDLLNIFSPQC